MQTDWLIVRRLAAELDRTLRGARIRAAGRLPDGRFGFATASERIAVDAFGPTPCITRDVERVYDERAGWVRALAQTLAGLRVERVRARRGDRLIAFECGARSRFGVTSNVRLVVELVPRFGNVVLLKDDTIVTAAREFSRAENLLRAVTIGEPYEPPPLRSSTYSGLDLPAALTALGASDDAERRRDAVGALGACVALVPRLAAESFAIEAARTIAAGGAPGALAERCVARAQALVNATQGEPEAGGDVFCYWNGPTLAAAHVIALAQFDGFRATRERSLLDVLTRALGDASERRAALAFDARRGALAARVAKRVAALARERAALERERDDAESRDDLRRAGELLYAHLGDVPAGATTFVAPSDPLHPIALDPALDAKANAAAIFKRYRKAIAKREHVAARLDVLEADDRFADDLAWEIERAVPETLGDIVESVDRLERRPPKKTTGRVARRKPLAVRVADDARIYVGRSPRENADLTFGLARPDDLWFHAQRIPGAHVVLRIDGSRAPTAGELERAAAFAAHHSKAAALERVTVDYTERKHVRRQQNAPPGLVWYTNARTIVANPADALAENAP